MAKYACPKCKSQSLDVSISTWARIIQTDSDNIETDTDRALNHDHEWDETSAVICLQCGFQGNLNDCAAPLRLQIVVWREHGDDDDSCIHQLFSAGDDTTCERIIRADYLDYPEKLIDDDDYNAEGDPEKKARVYYINDDTTYVDGEQILARDGRIYRIRFEEVLS